MKTAYGLLAGLWFLAPTMDAAINVYLTEAPDYGWFCGCFGTATGNLMGYWDRHGFSNFYTGPTGGGIAPLDSQSLNEGIRSLWASRAGFDGRPPDLYGHQDDYYLDFENTGPDPYILAGRPEHAPDCLGDFIGLSQNKWSNLNGECAGNIDGYAFCYWDYTGAKRVNFVPPPENGQPVRDIPSGLKAWTEYRGETCEVFSQLADVNYETPVGQGFTFADLKAEIDAGYPVFMFLQAPFPKARVMGTMTNANPNVHGMVAYGYYITDSGMNFVRLRDSWEGGDNRFIAWTGEAWAPDLPLRGVIGYHPLPKIKTISVEAGVLTLTWSGPESVLYDAFYGTATFLHWYMVECSTTLDPASFAPVAIATTNHVLSINLPKNQLGYFRVRLARPDEIPPP